MVEVVVDMAAVAAVVVEEEEEEEGDWRRWRVVRKGEWKSAFYSISTEAAFVISLITIEYFD